MNLNLKLRDWDPVEAVVVVGAKVVATVVVAVVGLVSHEYLGLSRIM